MRNLKGTLAGAALLVAGVLAATTDERLFGLVTDGQIMTRTAYSMVALGELGMARGHAVNRPRPEGDAVTRYGLGPSIVQTIPAGLAAPFEKVFGLGSSQTLFVSEQILWVVLAALGAGLLAATFSTAPGAGWRAALLAGLASPLAPYASSDYSEPLQAAVVVLAFAAAFRAASDGVDERRRGRLLLAAGAAAGFAVLTKSVLVVLLPLVLTAPFFGAPKEKRVRTLVFGVAGWLPFAAVWLAFEIVRFGRPFASYEGEHFNHPLLDGLWRLTVGPNKGMFLFFPASILAVYGAVRLFRARRAASLGLLGFLLFTLVTTAAWWSWDGIGGFGPRLLVPLVPLLSALAAEASFAFRPFVFRAALALGAAVTAIGLLNPSQLVTWYVTVLPARPLTDAEAERFPRFVRNRNPVTSRWELIPHADAANHAALSELVLGPWLLSVRWRGGDVLAALSKPPWNTSRPGFALAVPPEKAIPESALVFLTSRFRWPHLGMSLFRGAGERDTAIAYVDALYDQALRAQDMRRPDRAVTFAQRLFEKVPGPQSAATLAEAYRMANDTASLARLVDTLPPAQKAAPEFGLVLALYARDAGALDQAAYVLSEVVKAAPRPEFRRLTAVAPAAWPSSVREITRPEVEGLPAPR